jgi:predicted CxxxxCH...CXXCH cytochrome family protein
VNDCNKCHSSAGDGTGSAVGILGGGSHAKHTNTTSLDVSNCINCHSAYTTFQHATSAGQRIIRVQFNAPNIGGGTYSGGNMNYLPGQPGRTFGTCSATYCHGTAASDAWGTAGPLACNKCHGANNALQGAHGIHYNSAAVPAAGSYGTSPGNTNGAAYQFTCASCHGTDISKHADGPVVSGSSAATVYFSYSSQGRNPAYGSLVRTGTSQNDAGFRWTPGANGTCNATYCHSNGRGSNGSLATINWSSTATVNCDSCHGNLTTTTAGTNPATTPNMLSGAHKSHIANATSGGSFACIDCHATTVSANTTIKATTGFAKHVNKFVDYSGANAGRNKNCSNIYCHSNGKAAYVNPPTWASGLTLDCGGCHGAAVTGMPNTGNHAKHVAAGAGCQNCHASTTSNGTSITGATHIDRAISTNPGGTFKTVSVNFAGTTGCSTITCHGAGSPPANWNGLTLNCDGCHPLAGLSGGANSGHQRHMGLLTAATVNFYNYTANKSTGAETATVKYGFGCATCHPTTLASHINGSIDVVLHSTVGDTTTSALKKKTAATTVGGTIGTGTITCTATYCHGTGLASSGTTPAWNGTFANADRCANCHGNSPVTAAHSAHVVGIHYDDIFSGTSNKLPKADKASNATNAAHGYGRATTINCNICHSATVTSAANDKATTCSTATSCHGTGGVAKGNAAIQFLGSHVNGTIEVQFANVNIKSKAQVRTSSFSGYTASAAGWSRGAASSAYKSYTSSYDVSKNKLFGTAQWNAGTCDNVVCHNNKQVQWVPAQALTCDNCHGRL